MTSNEIRQSFLDFFQSKQHTLVKSGSLLPDSPNLLFTNAGMNQFVPIFLGQSNCPYSPGRAADTQKCIRAGGKHNDLDDVGLDTYHHTFFEMLGNWSFGDYFKKEAIDWAWELITKVWGFPKERLYATYFGGDDKMPADTEAQNFWLKYLPADHVVPGNRKDNFWMMGDTGPCGPCSELHVDLSPKGDGGAKMVNAGSAQCMEIWNLVFIQFNANPDGTFSPLPAKHVDTGMGFERACSVIQCTKGFKDFSGVISNYETDVFTPIFQALENMSGKKYGSSLTDPTDIAFRVIADHIRCLSFSIADGIAPSNEGRGYVLRRILRRAVRYGRALGFREPFFYKLADTVADSFGDAFPELRKNADRVQKTLKAEEESFNRTLDRGLDLFEQVVSTLSSVAEVRDLGPRSGIATTVFPANEAFRLYDTYGFPLDLTELLARERGLTVDVPGFEKLMEEQRNRARADHAKKKTVVTVESEGLEVNPTVFIGFDNLEAEALVEAISPVVAAIPDRGSSVAEVRDLGPRSGIAATEYNIILDKTPCYAEMGGQSGDTGRIRLIADENLIGELQILDTQKQGELIVHRAKLVSGRAPEPGEGVLVDVDAERRADIQRHHTATHLFHWALHNVVSKESRQRGSLVAPERMRFDFNSPEKISDEQIAKIEKLVNDRIKANEPVYWTEVPFTEVQKQPSIQQFFGEKYGDTVRVLQMGGHKGKFDGFSMELCGGCHVRNTGDIGLFKVMRESAIAAGIRRIEAVCGKFAKQFIEEQKAAGAAEAERTKEVERQKQLAKQRQAEMQAKAPAIAEELLGKIKDGLLIENMGEADAELLSAVMDALQPKLTSAVVILGGVSDGKVALVCAVTPDLVKAGKNAGKIVGAIAKQCGGGGGGKPDRAQAGGKLPEKLAEALDSAGKSI
ncbi:MAG: alanine--tRNA ligase [Kiritimatiellaceae bacterium]|nr:alanine--tRNA ligase [Kiritimatiellaceae bacterium]